MAAFANKGFELAGASAGLAASWTFSAASSIIDIADYGADSEPWEGFENGWLNDDYLLAFVGLGADLDLAVYYPGPGARVAEDFEAGWSNNSYLLELTVATPAVYLAADPFESFSHSTWGTAAYKTAFVPADVSVGDVDNFETGWSAIDIEAARAALSAVFYDSGFPYEGFEEGWTGSEMEPPF